MVLLQEKNIEHKRLSLYERKACILNIIFLSISASWAQLFTH